MKIHIFGSADVPSASFFSIADEDVALPKAVLSHLSNKIFMKV